MEGSIIVQVAVPTGNGSEYRTTQFEVKPAKLIAPPPPFDQQNIEHHPFYQEVTQKVNEIAELYEKYGYMEVGVPVPGPDHAGMDVRIPERSPDVPIDFPSRDKPWRPGER